jgi:serine/threonine protein kinase
MYPVALYFNRRRKQMLKDLTDRQRSNIPRNEIKLMDRIGRGASGTVYKAMFRGTEVAVKSILTGASSSAAVEEFMMETAIMWYVFVSLCLHIAFEMIPRLMNCITCAALTVLFSALRHPNIVLFMGSCFDLNQKEMLLVMEFCSRGSLHDLLNDPKVTLQYELLLHLACQAAQGMNFLHESSPPIIHRYRIFR